MRSAVKGRVCEVRLGQRGGSSYGERGRGMRSAVQQLFKSFIVSNYPMRQVKAMPIIHWNNQLFIQSFLCFKIATTELTSLPITCKRLLCNIFNYKYFI